MLNTILIPTDWFVSPNFPKIKFMLRINYHGVNVLTACPSGANEFSSLFIRPFRDRPYYVIGMAGVCRRAAGGGRRAGVHTGFRTITLVLYIESLPIFAT